MNKRAHIIFIALIFVLLLSGALFACTETTTKVESITFVTAPTRTYFVVGEELDVAGASLNIVFENGQSRVYELDKILPRVTITGFDNTVRKFNQTVTVTYDGQTATFTVDVVEASDVVDITFDSNGGSEVATQKAIKGKTLGDYFTAPTPTKDGLSFSGWYYGGTSTAWGFSTDIVTESMTLKAGYSATLTFVSSDGVTKRTVTRQYAEGSTVSQTTLDTIYNTANFFTEKSGYTRYYKLSDTDVVGLSRNQLLALEDMPIDYFSNLASSKTLYCVYVAELYKVYINFNGATSLSDPASADFPRWGLDRFDDATDAAHVGHKVVERAYGSTLDIGRPGKAFEVTGGEPGSWEGTYDLVFGGWYTDAAFTQEWDKDTSVVAVDGMTLYARFTWQLNFYAGTINGSILPTDNILEPIFFNEGDTFDYADLPAVPRTFIDNGGQQSFPVDGYSAWWSATALRYSEDSESAGIEYEKILGDGISLEQMLRMNGSGLTYIYANFYHIPYTLHFEDFSSLAPTGDINADRAVWYGRQIATIRGTPQKADLTFKGWCLDKQLTRPYTAGTDTVNGTVYRVGDEGFDASKNSGFSYGTMTLYAAYVAKLSFIRNSGNPDDYNSDYAFLIVDVDMEYLSDGVYAGSYLPPNITPWTGRDGYWYFADMNGVPDTGRGVADFSNITRTDFLAVKYVTKQYTVTYVADCSPSIPAFPAADYISIVGTAEHSTALVTYEDYAISRDTAYYTALNGGADFVDSEGIIWILEGWYKDTEFNFPYAFDSEKVLTNISIYAQWLRKGTDGLAYSALPDGTFSVSRGITANNITKLVVPAKHNGTAVTKIEASAFAGYDLLDKIYVADSVTVIEANAFNGCAAIAELPAFNTAIELGKDVFAGTAWLADAEADSSTEDKDRFVIFNGNTIYKYKKNAAEVTVPDYITIIGAGAFQNKTALTSVVLSNGVTAVRTDAFRNCAALVNITFSETAAHPEALLSAIGTGAFSRLSALENITVNGKIYKSVDGVLYRMYSDAPIELVLYPSSRQAEEYVLPNTISSIGDDAFFSQRYLKLLVFRRATAPTVPENLFAVAGGSFVTLQALQRIVTPADDTYGINNYTPVWAELPAEALAILKRNSININYVSPVSVGTYPKTVYEYGDEIVSFVPTNAYLTFEGWFLDALYTVPLTEADYVKWDALSTAAADWGGDGNMFTTKTFDVYAKWSAKLIFHISADNSVEYTVVAGDTLTAAQKATVPLYDKNGYLVRWHYDAVETLDLEGAVVRGGELYIAETIRNFSVTYMSHNDGGWVQYGETLRANFDTVLELPVAPEVWNPSLSYLVFSGWYSDETYNTPWVFDVTKVESDTVLYGRWLVPMTFVYGEVNGITVYEEEIIEYALYGGDMVAPQVAYAYGYVGTWKARSGEAPSYVYNDADFTAVISPRTYYAVYTRETYTVSFNTGGVGSVGNQSVDYGGYATKPVYSVTQVGKVFAGWYLDNEGQSEFVFGNTSITENLTLYAYWVTALDGSKGLRFYNATGAATDYYVTGISVVEPVAYIPSVAYDINNAALNGSTVYRIGANAFNGNANIKHLILPTTVTEIDPTAFINMPNLERITVLEGNTKFLSEDGVLYAVDNDGNKISVVKVPSKIKLTSLSIAATVSEVASYAFEGVENILNISFGSTTVVYLNEYALKDINPATRFFVFDKTNFLAYTNSTWAPYADRMYSSEVRISYKNPLDKANDFSGPGYVSAAEVLTALSQPATTPLNITVDGLTYVFGGWCTDIAMLNLYDFTELLTDNLELYARWVLVGTSGLEYKLSSVGTKRGYRVAIGSATDTDIVIKNFHNGLPVLAIATSAFATSNVTSVYIPATIIRIADTAFSNTQNLLSIAVDPNSQSFRVHNNALYSFDMKELICYPSAFDGLTEFTTAEVTERVAQYAFYYNRFLEKIVLTASVSNIGYAAFGNSQALVRVEVLNETPPAISADPFYNTAANIEIYVPGSNFDNPQAQSIAELYRERWIDSDRVGNIYPLTVRIYFMLDATTPFARVGGLPYTIDAAIFTKVQAPVISPLKQSEVFTGWFDQVYGGNLFSFSDTALTDDLVLYAHWKTITNGNNEIPPYLNYQLNAGDNLTVSINTTVDGYADLTDIVVASQYYIDGAYRNVTMVAANGFRNLTSLRTVVLPYTLTGIGQYAFAGCTALETLNVPGTIYSLGDGAFDGCSALKEIEIPSTITMIGKNMFRNCISLTQALLWGDVTYIGENAFSGCAKLADIDLGQHLVYLMAYAFADCIALQSVSLPATLKTVGKYAFSNCNSLRTATFAEGTVLTTVTIDSVFQNAMGVYAFYGCSMLQSVNIPGGLTALPDYMFKNCTELRAITIPNTVQTIGVEAFRGCRSLATVEFEALPEDIGESSGILGLRALSARSFMGCLSLGEITLPTTFATMNTAVFAECSSLTRLTFLSTSTPIIIMDTNDGYLTDPSSGFLYYADNAEIFVPATVGSINYVNLYVSLLPKDYTTAPADYTGTLPYERVFPLTAAATFHYLDNATEFDNETVETVIGSVHQLLTAPTAPTKEGFIFGGWSYVSGGETLTFNFESDVMPSTGIVLYARWILEGTSSLAYNLLDDGTMSVSRGTLYRENDVVISNYYYYLDKYRPVTRIESNLLSGTMVETLYIPDTVKYIADAAFTDCLTLKAFSISADNAFFAVVDGVLYDAAKTRIIRYPSAKEEVSFEIIAGVTTITEYTFESVQALVSFSVAASQTRFSVVDGVLYNASQTTIIAYPAMRNATIFTVLAGVSSIYRYALTLAETSPLAAFEVEAGNVWYTEASGVLFRREVAQNVDSLDKRRVLVRYPTAASLARYVVPLDPDGAFYVTSVAQNAFRNVTSLLAVSFDSVTPIAIGADCFADMTAYILVPSAALNDYKNDTSSNWGSYTTRILRSVSVLTFDFNNGDAPLSVDVDTLDVFPSLATLGYALPTLAYSQIEGWYDTAFNTRIEFDQTSAIGIEETDGYFPAYYYVILDDTTVRVKWLVADATADLSYNINSLGTGYVVRIGAAVPDAFGAIIIPSYYNNLPVVGIAENGFAGLTSLKKIVVPETVTAIGTGAFSGCINLENITLLSTVPPSIPANEMKDLRDEVAQLGGKLLYVYVRSDVREAYVLVGTYLTANRTRNVEGTVIINANNGEAAVNVKVVLGVDRLTRPADPIPEPEKSFDGWYYMNGDVETAWDFDAIVVSTGSVTVLELYAKYS